MKAPKLISLFIQILTLTFVFSCSSSDPAPSSDAITADGNLFVWGANRFGELGDGTNEDAYSPEEILPDKKWKLLSLAYENMAGIQSDGTLWVWGDNTHGQIGDATFERRTAPVQVGNDNDWISVSTSGYTTLAIKKNNSLWAWGDNTYGQLGDGAKELNSNVPIQIGSNKKWSQVSAATRYTLAITTTGELWAWGINDEYELGIADISSSNVPVRVNSDTNWKQVAAAGLFAMAIKNNGTLWGWGNNYYGNVGVPNSLGDFYIKAPTLVQGASDWKEVSCGERHTLAINTSGRLFAWGSNNYGELGLDSSKTSPTQVGTESNWVHVGAGDSFSVALKNDGSAWGWGFNAHGQLEDNVVVGESTHTQSKIGGSNTWKWIGTGSGSMSVAGLK